jgi:hypothetical protein
MARSRKNFTFYLTFTKEEAKPYFRIFLSSYFKRAKEKEKGICGLWEHARPEFNLSQCLLHAKIFYN